jgi:hypothetical protein
MKQVLTALLALSVAIASVSAWAQFRTIPKDAKRGELTHVTQNIVSVDGQQMRLAPGALIYAQNNLTIVPSEVPRNSLVEYVLDRNGELFKVWILTAAEAARPNPNSSGGRWIEEKPITSTPIQQVLPAPSSGSESPAKQ